jgi:phosphonate degradation associated HDIG domain protein
MQELLDEIHQLFEQRGARAYMGEAVSEQEHALQSALAAEQEHAPDWQVVAALLHDVGHLLHAHGEDCADRGIDARHEDLGAAWLRDRLGPRVAELVRLHVDAKRFLCATDTAYRATLSPASILSLQLQGGPMAAEEIEAFRSHPLGEAAIALRRWDDQAKIPGMLTPPLEHYLPRIAHVVREEGVGCGS